MKLGYLSFIVKHGLSAEWSLTLSEYFREIARIGYESVEVCTYHGQAGHPAYLKKKGREQLRRTAEDLNLEICAIGAYGGSPRHTTDFGYLTNDRDERRYIISYMKHCIDLAVDLNSEVVNDLSGVKPEEMTNKQAWDTLSSSIGEVCDYAHEKDIYLAIEIGWDKLVHSPETFLHLAKEIRSSALKCLFDPSNLVIGGIKNIQEGVDRIYDYIIHVHLKGVKKGNIVHGYEFARPCSSFDEFDHEGFLAALKRKGYDRSIVIEELHELYRSPMNLEPFESARIAYEEVNKTLKKLALV